jgi:RNA polymerase sigma-70 factor (ECF subfamily)
MMSSSGEMIPASESPQEETVRVLLAEKGRLLAFLEERVGSRADAEDLLQTAMLRVVTKGHAVRSRDRIIPWFYRVLKNLLVDWHRRRATAARALRRLERSASVTQDHDKVLWRQVCTCVSRILVTLRLEYTEILGRVELDEQPVVEAARELGISANNASVRLLRARRALLERLRATCGACFEHGCLDCFCRTPETVRSGAARLPPSDEGEV